VDGHPDVVPLANRSTRGSTAGAPVATMSGMPAARAYAK
jgi:hypothetical protein